MLASITPLGERGRGRRWSVTAGALTAGCALGGMALALPGALVGRALPAATALRVAALAVVWLAAALLDLGGVVPPGPHRQVDERWLGEYRGWVVGAGFGLQLGAGAVTIVPTFGVYAVALSAAVMPSAAAALAVGAGYGLARALPVLAAARVRGPQALRVMHRRLAAAASPARRVAVAGHACAGLLAVVLLR